MTGGVLAFNLAGQACQAVEQLGFFVAAGTADGACQLSQVALGIAQHFRRFTCGGQTHQRGHAVGFNLQQLLNQAPQAAGRYTARQEQHARKTVGMNGKVGVHLGIAIGHS